MKELYISSFSISVLNIAIMLGLMLFFLFKNTKNKISWQLTQFLTGVNLVFCCFFLIFSSIDMKQSVFIWQILHLVVFATVPMVQFAYSFPKSSFEKEAKILKIITILLALIGYPIYLYKSIHLTPKFIPQASLFVFENTPEIGIIFTVEIIWLIGVFYRKRKFLTEYEKKITTKLMLIFLSPIILVLTIILAYLNLCSWEIVGHLLGSGLMIFVFFFINTYINNIKENTTILIKLIGISVGAILITTGFASHISIIVKEESYHDRIREKNQIIKSTYLPNSNEIRDKSIFYILEKGSDKIYYRKPDINIKVHGESKNNLRQIINDGKMEFAIISNIEVNGKILEIGRSYKDYRNYIHQTAKNLVYLIIFTVLLVFTVFPLFFKNVLLTPLKKLLYSIKDIDQGLYDTNVLVESSDEIGILANGLSKMATSIKVAQEKLNLAYKNQITLTTAYERFVPKEILKFLGKDNITQIKLGDNIKKEMTILFSDIRSFTKLSEHMGPQDNFKFINSYLKRVGPIVRAHHGIIDKFIGDAIMAIFDNNANDAIKSAIDMQHEIKRYNEKREKNHYIKIESGIGIHTGDLMLGTIGEHERMEGTVISDAVNLASRIEGLTKQYGVHIIISETTDSKIEKSDFKTRLLDTVQVKGKNRPINIIEIYDADSNETIILKDQIKDRFEKALGLYQMGEIKKAHDIFSLLKNEFPNDRPIQIYIERTSLLLDKGIPEDFNGITKISEK